MSARTFFGPFAVLVFLVVAGRANAADPPQAPPPKRVAASLASPLPAGAVARLGDTRLRHAAPATCIVISPDSRHIISGGRDEMLRVWDARTGEAVRSASIPFAPLALQFTKGGTRLALAAGNGSPVLFYDPETLKELATYSTGSVEGFALSENGKLIASITPNNELTVSDIETGLPRLEIPIEGNTGHRFAFLPDGKSIALADRAGKVTLFRVAGGKPWLTIDHGGPIDGLAVRGDGKRLATGSEAGEGTLKIWALDGRNETTKPLAVIHGVSRPRAWFGTDRLAAADREGAGVFDLARRTWAGYARGATGEWAVSPDERFIASTGTTSLRVRVWDLPSGKQLHAQNDSFPNVALLAPTADGKALFILAGDVASLWQVGRPEADAAGQLPASAIVAAAGWKRLAVATAKEVLIFDEFDPARGIVGGPDRRLAEWAAGPRAIAVSPDGKKVAYSGQSERIVVADAATGKTIRVLPGKTIGLGLAITADGSKLAVVGRDAFLRMWSIDVAGGEDSDLWRVRLQRAPRAAVAISPDGLLVAATSATMIKVVSSTTGEVVAQLDRRDIDDGIFQHVAFTPDSRSIVTGSAGLSGAIHVYDLTTRASIRRFTTSLGSIHRLAVFPDGSQAATAGAEEVITLWDLTGKSGMHK
jgi:WD40 repeat protein